MTMKISNPAQVWIARAILVTAAAMPFGAFAGPGHDHGEEKAPSNTAIAPRFSGSSAQLEAVGIVRDHQLHVYVDHAKTNAPLETTSIELKINDTPLALTQHEVGHFEADMPDPKGEGHLAVNMTIEANGYTEQLNSELELEHAHDEEASEQDHTNYTSMGLYGLAGLALISALSLAFRAIQRFRRTSR